MIIQQTNFRVRKKKSQTNFSILCDKIHARVRWDLGIPFCMNPNESSLTFAAQTSA